MVKFIGLAAPVVRADSGAVCDRRCGRRCGLRSPLGPGVNLFASDIETPPLKFKSGGKGRKGEKGKKRICLNHRHRLWMRKIEKCVYMDNRLKLETRPWKLASGYGYYFSTWKKNLYSSKKKSLWLLLHLPCDPHSHYGFHIWQNRKCLVICASYSEYGVRTEDVAVVLETFPFKHKGFFSIQNKKNPLWLKGNVSRTTATSSVQTPNSL